MNKSLVDMLVCPSCHSDLYWKIIAETNGYIVEANMKCVVCSSGYHVIDGIAVFVSEYESETSIDMPQIKQKSSSNPLSNNEVSFTNYSLETQNALGLCIDVLATELQELPSGSILLDFAAGHGNLFFGIVKRSDIIYIINDINLSCLKYIKRTIGDEFNSHFNYIAYNAEASPFRCKSVTTAISLLGLQHIANYNACINDLRRIVKKNIIHISSFCHEDDRINILFLRRRKIADMWSENKFFEALMMANMTYEILLSIKSAAKGVSRMEERSCIGRDMFPLVDTNILYMVAKMRIK